MKKIAIIIGIASAIMLHCSLGGPVGDLTGGGVIGNPATAVLTYTDTIHCRVVTKYGGRLDPDGGPPAPIMPFGADTARINQQQLYGFPGASAIKRFRFATPCGEQFSSWSPDSVIEWTWTTAGICSVQVQRAENADTSTWSEPLIVKIVE
jgi:hypothetical protein